MAARIVFLPSNIHKPGGAGYVEAWLIRGLIDLGFEVVVLNFADLSKQSQNIIKPVIHKVKLIKPFKYANNVKFLGRYILNKYVINILKSLKPNIIWLMASTPRDIVLEAKSLGAKTIVYYHMIAPWYYEIRGYYRKYSWRDLSIIFLLLNRIFAEHLTYDLHPHSAVDAVVVNSKYMQMLAYRYWHIKPFILPPPVSVEAYYLEGREERYKQVICFGRISPEKRYEHTIKAVGISETKPRVIIAGALEGRRSLNYAVALAQLAKKLHVNLEIYPNVSEETKKKLFSKSMIYIHNALAEHFGVTVIEAMALGLPVIVHRSGEPFHGIIEHDRFGLSYSSIDELARNIDLLINSENEWEKYHRLSLERAREYDYERFKKKLEAVISHVL